MFSFSATEIATHTIVHVVYGERDFSEFEQNMISTWYELLSYLGGTLSFVIGGSMLTVIELLYYCTGRFGTTLYRRIQQRITGQDEPIPFIGVPVQRHQREFLN